MDFGLISIVREDSSIITVPKSVVLNYLYEMSKDSALEKIMTLEEYHLSSDPALPDGFFDYNEICERRKFAETCKDSFLVYFKSFEPKNVPFDIVCKYLAYVDINHICFEYFLIKYYEKTDFTDKEDSMGTDTYDTKIIKHTLMRDGKPMAIVLPVIRKPLAEMNDSEMDDSF